MSVTIRPWSADDAGDLRAAVAASPDLDRQLPDVPLDDDAACAEVIRTVLAPQDPATWFNLAVVVDGCAVGNVGVSAVDRTHETGWVHYWMSVETRGRGLTTRAVATVARWALDELGLFRLELGHRVNNPASCAVATRAGFVAEGIERAKLRYGDERFDVETHARLRTDPRPDLEALPMQPVATP